MRKWALVLCIFAFWQTRAQQAWAQQAAQAAKFALVIGNGNYTSLGRLRNPVNDAEDMSAVLKDLGFTVDKALDCDLERMESAVMRLKSRLSASKNSYGFFFYAGHGVQSNGVNYLIPVGANIPSENSLRSRSVSVQWLLDELNDAGNELNVVALDACRDNPFTWGRTGSRGLTVVGSQPADSIVVYATGAGQIAQDGEGRNGLFTSRLLNNLKTPGLEVAEIFRRTGQEVSQASGRKQVPAVYSQFFGTAIINPLTVAQAPNPPPVTVAPSPPPVTVAPSPPPVTVAPSPPPVTVAPSPPPQPVSAPLPETPKSANVPISTPLPTPSLVRIQGGTFTMGSPISEKGRDKDEARHEVTVSSFSMGKYEVTQTEYESVMGTNPSHLKRSNLPVVDVSWYDAIEYCNRLSQRERLTPVYQISGVSVKCDWNASGYRLPTEAEWEYACRAGTTTAYNTGSTLTTNTGWYSDNSNSIQPVGQKPANAWGLYDMHGNVWEWCWDWYGDYLRKAQTNPRGPIQGSFRVIRGGSWYKSGHYLRSASRGGQYRTSKYDNFGFRVARN